MVYFPLALDDIILLYKICVACIEDACNGADVFLETHLYQNMALGITTEVPGEFALDILASR